MLQKFLSLALASLLIQVICVTPVPAGQQTDKETQRIAEVKERISAIGLVEKKRDIITRRDSTKLTGRVSEIKKDSFVITDDKTGTSSTVAYSDVTQVKSKGDGLSRGTKITIGARIAAAAVITWGIIYSRSCPSPFACR
jgi:hypothetical protein